MPVSKWSAAAFVLCAAVLVGCPKSSTQCPEGSVTSDVLEIPEGQSQVELVVEIDEPFPVEGVEIVTEIVAESGSVGDPFALQTTYTCAFDVTGPVEVCVNTKYVEAGSGDAGLTSNDPIEPDAVGSQAVALRTPHVRLSSPLSCEETRCATVICPDSQNVCPTISSITVEPEILEPGQTATIRVLAEDQDENPSALTTTLSSSFGEIDDESATQTSYTCDPDVGGVIEICVTATDGDASCETERCTTVRCPGDPLENTCPIIESFSADPNQVPSNGTTEIMVEVLDPDAFPSPLITELSSTTGIFDDRFVNETTFRCGASGDTTLCVEASDGDPDCDEFQCITVRCPGDIPPNICPMLNVINAIPAQIPPGETSTSVESRGQDNDGLPMPLVLEMRASWGMILNQENFLQPPVTPGAVPVTAQDATYVCDRPGPAEICVDATDGACQKTLCIEVECPDDIPLP